jgi:hypothetical protein
VTQRRNQGLRSARSHPIFGRWNLAMAGGGTRHVGLTLPPGLAARADQLMQEQILLPPPSRRTVLTRPGFPLGDMQLASDALSHKEATLSFEFAVSNFMTQCMEQRRRRRRRIMEATLRCITVSWRAVVPCHPLSSVERDPEILCQASMKHDERTSATNYYLHDP